MTFFCYPILGEKKDRKPMVSLEKTKWNNNTIRSLRKKSEKGKEKEENGFICCPLERGKYYAVAPESGLNCVLLLLGR